MMRRVGMLEPSLSEHLAPLLSCVPLYLHLLAPSRLSPTPSIAHTLQICPADPSVSALCSRLSPPHSIFPQ